MSITRVPTEQERDRAYKIDTLLHFDEEQEICRGSRLTKVLHTMGAIFADSGGSAATYELSDQVERIDAFISHNWSLPRWKKFMILSMHFNYVPAVIVSIAVMILLFTLTCTGVLPQFAWEGSDSGQGLHKQGYKHRSDKHNHMGQSGDRKLQESEENDDDASGIWSQTLSTPVFIVVLFTWHEIHRMLGRGLFDPYVFLDKTCIHQTDADLKKNGIMKLGAFLDKSAKMVIIYSDVYLRKLWTVYEVASFLCIHPVHDMLLYPVDFAFAELGFIVLCYLATLSKWIFVQLGPKADNIAFCAVCIAVHVLLRAWSYVQAGVQRHIHDFDVHNTVCFCEDDRPLVYANIADFMVYFNFVDSEASQEKALDAFNELVHRELPSAIDESLGSVGLRYSWVSIAFLLTFLPSEMDHLAADLERFPELTPRDVFIATSGVICMVFFVCPLYVAVSSVASGRFLHRGRCCDCFWVAIGLTITSAVATGLLAAIDASEDYAYENPGGTSLIPIIMLKLLLLICTTLAYSSRFGSYVRRLISGKTPPDSERRSFLGVSQAIQSSDKTNECDFVVQNSAISMAPEIQIVGHRSATDRE